MPNPTVKLLALADIRAQEVSLGKRPITPIEQRLEPKIDRSGGPEACHPYTGAIGKMGYGTMRVAGAKSTQCGVHKIAFLLAGGVLEPGQEVGHLCHDLAYERGQCAGGSGCPHRRCCNPAHHSAMDRRENVLAAGSRTAVNARKVVCVRGHDLTEPANLYDYKGVRHCRLCQQERERERSPRIRDRR